MSSRPPSAGGTTDPASRPQWASVAPAGSQSVPFSSSLARAGAGGDGASTPPVVRSPAPLTRPSTPISAGGGALLGASGSSSGKPAKGRVHWQGTTRGDAPRSATRSQFAFAPASTSSDAEAEGSELERAHSERAGAGGSDSIQYANGDSSISIGGLEKVAASKSQPMSSSASAPGQRFRVLGGRGPGPTVMVRGGAHGPMAVSQGGARGLPSQLTVQRQGSQGAGSDSAAPPPVGDAPSDVQPRGEDKQATEQAQTCPLLRPTPVHTTRATSSSSLMRVNHPGPLMLDKRLSNLSGIPPTERGPNAFGLHDESTSSGTGAGGVAGFPTNGHRSSETMPSGMLSAPAVKDAQLELTHTLSEQFTPPPANGGSVPVAPPNAGGASGLGLVLSGAKSLDERGLDDRAFLELQRELERHEAARKQDEHDAGAAAVSHAPPAAQDDDDDDGDSDQSRRLARDEEHYARRRFRGMSGYASSRATSGASTPGGWSTDSGSGSYNPAADSDLEYVDIAPGEVDGMPSRRSRLKAAADATKVATDAGESDTPAKRSWLKVRKMLVGAKGDSDVGDVEKAGRPARACVEPDTAGPTNRKSVAVETSSGVRGTDRKPRPTRYEREAARLVRAHLLMRGAGVSTAAATAGVRRHDGEGESSMPPLSLSLVRGRSINRKHLARDSGASTPDALETSTNLDARPVQSGGVLGNLLMLYEQQQHKMHEADESRTRVNSEATSEASAKLAAPQEQRVADTRNEEQHRYGYRYNPLGVIRRPFSRAGSRSGSPVSTPRIRKTLASGSMQLVGAAAKTVKVVANEAGFEDVMEERPKAARSDAGVIGALIATTGNLIGAVSPASAQLGPNPNRSGFTLDRYLLPEMNAKTLKRTAQIIADASVRPSRSRPGTPGSRSGAASPIPRIDSGRPSGSGGPTSPTGLKKRRDGTSSSGFAFGPDQHLPYKRSSTYFGAAAHATGTALSSLRPWLTHSTVNTPVAISQDGGDYFGVDPGELDEKAHKAEWQRKLRKRAKEKRRKEEIFITMHVAAILQRQQFILKLARALMMFGAPTHRIETQIQQTARVLEINCRCIYFPNLMLVAFGDDATHTSETKFIKQAGVLDLTKLTDMHTIYWKVIHDKVGVDEASGQLDELMRRKPLIRKIPMVIIGGFCSAFICVGPMGFNGSFADALLAFPLGAFLVWCQSIITAELYSNVFEIVFAAVNSFIASAAYGAGRGPFCYSAIVSGSIVLILPGFIVLSGALELQSKNLVAGSVRLVYAIIYSLLLGFGLSIGASLWTLFSGQDMVVTSATASCSDVHVDLWYRQKVDIFWAFLTVPGYSICLSLRNHAKVTRKEFPVMVIIAIAGWATNHFLAQRKQLATRQDFTAMLGSLVVGLLANLYGRVFDGRAFVVSVPGILYQLPSGLSQGGLLLFANSSSDANSTFSNGFAVAQSLVQVALGLSVGLFTATVISYTLGGKKSRGGGLFSF
ncbi:DUF1212-domain-containing protein [Tilletiaria anomala UBC 951]|uniref:DUF1212-domain-containing protein n=1 Tax=Tilletiaria anomala (strain ATCC 24038 / CBS 436.72 / UBC 951) TaxID=1037660 RepID=A0A066VYD0_TILAU|nr:DUF1212-domain-containing protein [Tilletiaria anomala UBC 951]KDN45288.1 DUF1212-domain-containing protein [Tilletiaria anomala UBC 951]